jgi:glutamate formiminotransferase/formiminotetrahydrofolate cyclodeaminase
LHAAFDECVDKARARGMRVTGSEAVGLIPLQAMLDAGRHYLHLQQRSTGVPDSELIKIAVRSMGLDELSPFDPRAKIIEYAIEDAGANPLVHASLAGFTERTASEAPAPGGGSVAAAVGAMGAALGTMVANLSSHKRGWDERWEEFSAVAERGKAAYVELLALVDKDTEAFHGIMEAWKAAPEERDEAIQAATRVAIEVPLRVMEVSVDCMQVCADMAESGMEASLSDAGVGALCARTAALGAYLNVRINASDLKDEDERKAYLDRAGDLRSTLEARESEVLAIVEAKLG